LLATQYRQNKVDVSQWLIYCVVITIGDIVLQDVQLFFGNSALLYCIQFLLQLFVVSEQ
jgi:hypothetical protein